MKDKAELGYYPYFDYLRLVLASVVMFSHAGAEIWQPSGKLAVDIFFALSGWLIGDILLKSNRDELPRFYFNRAIRIWIPYYIALSLIIIPSLIVDPLDSKWVEFIVYKIAQVYNIFGPTQLAAYKDSMPLNGIGNHFWSVNAEEQFYLLAPLLLVLFPRVGKSLLTWTLILLVVWSFWIYPPISLGVFAALLKYNYPDFHKSNGVRFVLLSILIIAVVGISSAVSFRDIQYRLFSPLLATSLVLLLAINGRKSKFGELVGGISYPLYLNHWIGIVITNRLIAYGNFDNSLLKYFLLSIINISIATLLYVKIERVAIYSRTTWYTHQRGVICMVIAYSMLSFGLVFGLANLALRDG